MANFNFYTDANLTVVFSGEWAATQLSNGTSPMATLRLWLGSPTTPGTLQAASAPGVDQITVSIVDLAPSAGHPATELKLALTEGGLATATGGSSLNLGTEIQSGVNNAVSFWIGWKDNTHVLGTSSELSWQTNPLTVV